jgi:hypothetical protein
MAEICTVNAEVGGSSPSLGAKYNQEVMKTS